MQVVLKSFYRGSQIKKPPNVKDQKRFPDHFIKTLGGLSMKDKNSLDTYNLEL